MWFRGRGKADRATAAYQRELVDTHYREVENMYRQMRMGGMTTVITFRR